MPRAVRERHMLDAAVRVFGRQGYRAAAMDDIAELAGVPQPLVHLYLRSKEDLFVACVRREAGALLAAVRGGVRAGDPAERQLRDGLHAFFQHTVRHPEGWAVLHLHARAQGESSADQVVALRTELVGLVTRLIVSAARDAGAPRRSDGVRPWGSPRRWWVRRSRSRCGRAVTRPSRPAKRCPP